MCWSPAPRLMVLFRSNCVEPLGSGTTWKQKVTTNKTLKDAAQARFWLPLCFLDYGDVWSSHHYKLLCASPNLRLCAKVNAFSLSFPVLWSPSLWVWYGHGLEVRAGVLSCRRPSELSLQAFSHEGEKSSPGHETPPRGLKVPGGRIWGICLWWYVSLSIIPINLVGLSS